MGGEYPPHLAQLLLRLKWWDFEAEHLAEFLPVLCDIDLESVRSTIAAMLKG